jgi:subtilisin
MISQSNFLHEYFYDGSFSLIRPGWLKSEIGNVTGRGIKVAVIDSGCSELLNNDSRVEKGISFIDDSNGFTFSKSENYFDQLGHGTTCTDVILQVAPNIKVIPIKVFNSKLETSIEILYHAINYAIDANVDLINLSLGTKLPEALNPLYFVCERAKKENTIVISANANHDVNSYPAIFENVISVRTGIKTNDKFYYDYCEDELCECLANGSPSDALTLTGLRHPSSGNSFAAPVMTGIIALFLEKYGQSNLSSIRQLLQKYSMNKRGNRLKDFVR